MSLTALPLRGVDAIYNVINVHRVCGHCDRLAKSHGSNSACQRVPLPWRRRRRGRGRGRRRGRRRRWGRWGGRGCPGIDAPNIHLGPVSLPGGRQADERRCSLGSVRSFTCAAEYWRPRTAHSKGSAGPAQGLLQPLEVCHCKLKELHTGHHLSITATEERLLRLTRAYWSVVHAAPRRPCSDQYSSCCSSEEAAHSRDSVADGQVACLPGRAQGDGDSS